MAMEHLPWIGPDYKFGLEGQRLAIVGYSHWLWDGHEDEIEGTRHCIAKIVSGDERISFFTAIRNYFGYDSHDDFWRYVMFFNYLPNCVGGSSRRFGDGTAEQIGIAKKRFLRLIREGLPDKIFIFTSRRWAFPQPDGPLRQLHPEFSNFLCGTYIVNGHRSQAFFLRHPQGAGGELMRQAVKFILDRRNPGIG